MGAEELLGSSPTQVQVSRNIHAVGRILSLPILGGWHHQTFGFDFR